MAIIAGKIFYIFIYDIDFCNAGFVTGRHWLKALRNLFAKGLEAEGELDLLPN